jgi:hypothetical protein
VRFGVLCGRAGRHAAESEQRARRNCRLHRRCSATTWRAPRRTTQAARARKLSRGRTFGAQRHSATPRRLSSCARMGRRCSATLRSRRRYSTRQGWSVTTGTAPYCGAVLLGAHAMPSRGEIASCLRHSDVWNGLEQTGTYCLNRLEWVYCTIRAAGSQVRESYGGEVPRRCAALPFALTNLKPATAAAIRIIRTLIRTLRSGNLG